MKTIARKQRGGRRNGRGRKEDKVALTEREIGIATNYLIRQMTADAVDFRDVGQVIRYLILNPLPSKEVYEAAEVAEEEAQKQRQIVALRDQLTKLEGR